MAISSAWILSVVVTVWFAAEISQADRSSHSMNMLAHPSSGRTEEQALQDSSDNRYNYDRIKSGNPSESDLYLSNVWNSRTRQGGPLAEDAAFLYQKLSPIDTTWSKSDLPMLSDEPMHDRGLSVQKSKREGHSLSIVNPLDVLRQRMILEMARRRMKENQEQIKANDVILKTLGKRQSSRDDSDCDEEEMAKRRAKEERRRGQRHDYLDNAQDAVVDDFVV